MKALELTFYNRSGAPRSIQDIRGWSGEEIDQLIGIKARIDGQRPHDLIRHCAYCDQPYGLVVGTEQIGISHGICPACLPAAKAELRAAMEKSKLTDEDYEAFYGEAP